MPDITAVNAAQTFRNALLKSERESAVRLVNAYGNIYTKLQDQINGLINELDIMAAEEKLTTWKAGKLSRLKNLQSDIESEINKYAVIAENEMDQGAKAAIEAAQANAKAITKAALPGIDTIDNKIMQQWQKLDPGAVESLLGFLSDSSPLRAGLRNKLGPDVADAVSKKLLEGIALGYNPRKTAGIIRNELGQGLTSTLKLARTTQLYAYRESTRASYMANKEIVPQWKWLSARDQNTCMACLSEDGSLHDSTETLNDHWNGKCAMLPVPISYKDLGLNVDDPKSFLEHQTGEEWYKSQPESVQRKMMGNEKFNAFKKKEFEFKELSHTTKDPVFGNMRSETSLKDLMNRPTGKSIVKPEIPRTKVSKLTNDPATQKLLDELPEGMRKKAQEEGLKGVRIVKDMSDPVARRDKSIVATFLEDSSTIEMRNRPIEEMRQTLTHEIAHVFDKPGVDGKYVISEGDDWLKAAGWKQSKSGTYKLKSSIYNRPVSDYGGTSPWEDFAEAFSKYHTGSDFDRRVMRGESEGRYAFLEKFSKALGL